MSFESQRQRWRLLALPFTGFLLVVVVCFSLMSGAMPLSLETLFSSQPTLTKTIVFEIRLPRVILAIFVGAGLGVCGAAMQALFRNPLADPGLIGVAGGGALGAVTVIVLGNSFFLNFSQTLGIYAIPLGAMIGCLCVCAIIYHLSYRQGQLTISTLLLAGIAVNAVVGSIIGILTMVSDDNELRELTFWTMGNLGGNSWELILPVLIAIGISLFCINRLAKPLNLYLLGEAQAQHLGIAVVQLKKQVFFFTALAVGAAVAISGIIGFVGFVVPHLVRILIGPDHRFLLPISMCLGASLLTLADLVARLVLQPTEIPIGLITSAIGGPFFLAVIYKMEAQT